MKIIPYHKQVLIKPDPEGIKSELIEVVQEKTYDQCTGTLLDFGSEAFSDWGRRPQKGERVVYRKYKGEFVRDYDVRLIEDKEVYGGIFDS